MIADFFRELAETSDRPKSKLNCAVAAINHVYDAMEMTSPGRSFFVRNLIEGLIRCNTNAPMKKSTVLPVAKFCDLFTSWKTNDLLSVKDLRLKTITLLSLSAMLRPSDIAPKTLTRDPITGTPRRVMFSTSQLNFNDDGSLKIRFFGIKNDTRRDGFEVQIPPHSCEKLDPVAALKVYIGKTASFRDKDSSPVFLTLRSPYNAIDASTVGDILQDAIKLVGLQNQGFSAKSFRPTGATNAIAQNFDPQIVRKIGRWKTESVFFEHYVHSNTPKEFTDKLLNT